MNFDAKEKAGEIMKDIKDLERELDWMYSREADEFKYIAHLEARVRELYAKIDKLDEAN